MDVLFRIRAGKDGLKKAGIICVSALFRPVPAVAKTGTVKNAGHFRRSLRKLLSFYILECHAYTIYLLFTKAFCKSRMSRFFTMCGTISDIAMVCGYKVRLFPASFTILWCLHMQEVLYLTAYTWNFYFWILLSGREVYFLGLVYWRRHRINIDKYLNNLYIYFYFIWRKTSSHGRITGWRTIG